MDLPTHYNDSKIPIPVVNKSNNELPEYAHPIGDSGMDIRAYIKDNESIWIYPKEVKTINTGLYVHIPHGFEIQVRPRSGLSKLYVNLANCVGTIDSNYRGEIMLLVYNFGDDPYKIESGDRVAQLVLAPVYHIVWKLTDSLEESNRNDGGFGHTGIK